MQLAETVYQACKTPPLSKDYGLKNKIQRAVVSIPSNIAEGDERGSNPLSVYYLNIAKGSVAEIITQLEIANRIGYLDKDTYESLMQQSEKAYASLINLIRARSK